MARRIVSILTLLLILDSGSARLWGQYIPPARVPETAEPPLADRSKAGDVPEILRPAPSGPAPVGITALPPTTPDPPTPSVSIHVAAPATASAGGDVEYKILVENKSQAAAHHVKVTCAKPEGIQLTSLEPAVAAEDSTKTIAWRLDTLKPGESRTIRLSARPLRDGLETVELTARVQFEHGQRVRTVLQRPQLAIRKITNQHALEKQDVPCKLIVENTGTVEVSNITVREFLGEGLALVVNGQEKGPLFTQTIPALAPKQSREFTYTVRGGKTGTFESKIEATGERGAKATADWKIDVGPSPLTVKLTGPKQIYLNYPARYDIEVSYAGTTALENVVASFSLPRGMKVVRATPGSQSFEDRLQWPIKHLASRQKLTFSVWGQMSTAGTVPNFAQILWRGPPQRAEFTTEFVGAAALHLELKESNDPIRLGDKVRYTLTVSNRGTKAADVRLLVSYPVTQFALDVDGTDGRESKQGLQEIDLKSVPPKGHITKVVTLKATGTGQAIIHVEMESSELTAGNVTREESTTITR